jgi:hypothetical protein
MPRNLSEIVLSWIRPRERVLLWTKAFAVSYWTEQGVKRGYPRRVRAISICRLFRGSKMLSWFATGYRLQLGFKTIWQITKELSHTDKKEKKIFLIYKEIQSGAVAKSYMYEEGLPNIWGNAQIVPHIWGGRKSYRTLQLLHSEFPYIIEENLIFFFISAWIVNPKTPSSGSNILNGPDVAAAAISGVVAPVFLLTLVSSYPVFLGLAILFGFLTGIYT